MAGGNCTRKNYNAVTNFSNKRKKVNTSTIPFFSEEIISSILVCLPADIVYNVMRHVCRQWSNIICSPGFIKAHVLRSTSGLFFQQFGQGHSSYTYFLEIGDEDVTIKEIDLWFPNRVKDSCDGLVVFQDRYDMSIFHVANPVTKEMVKLPPLIGDEIELTKRIGLGCVPTSGVYKTVCIVMYPGFGLGLKVLSVGVDSVWRSVDISHISRTALIALCFDRIFAKGYFHWLIASWLLTLDLETEVIQQFPLLEYDNNCKSVARQVGNSLLLIVCNSGLVCDVWELIDPRTGVWSKLYNIDLEDQTSSIKNMSNLTVYVDTNPFICLDKWKKAEMMNLEQFRFNFNKSVSIIPSPGVCLKSGELFSFFVYESEGIFLGYSITGGGCSFVNNGYISESFHITHVNSLVSPRVH